MLPIPLAWTPFDPSTSVTFRTEPVSASAAPGTAYATALAAPCIPSGYSIVVAVAGWVGARFGRRPPVGISTQVWRGIGFGRSGAIEGGGLFGK